MATSKKRINISLPEDIEDALIKVSKRDNTPQATVAIYLLKKGLEIEEDEIWNEIAEKRDKKGAKFISHKDVWK